MNELPNVINHSSLWRSTLASIENDEHIEKRHRLSSSFISFRERAAQLANEIRKDLPNLTIHDISHLDALWEIGSLVVGQNYSLTPTEGYVLGGAILLHDLAMSIAATPGGYSALKEDPRWSDLVFTEYQEKYDRDPEELEIVEPEAEIKNSVLFNLLRQVHAENAEKLAFVSFKPTNGDALYLIEDTELRHTFGRIIGQVAHSHWWSLSKVERKFNRVIGAPHWTPADWTIDPFKIACILRAADASHLDARRAPHFVKAFSNISKASETHWGFQEKLNKPYLLDDAIVFTSAQAFTLSEAGSWWSCIETLKMVDRELRVIDSLLADKHSLRFSARRVAGADSLEILASYVQTDGWLPIKANIHVSDLPHIIKSIGGEELYGKRPTVPLRELIQNASDAIRARRIIEKRDSNFGQVDVSLINTDDNGYLLQIKDNGIGMSVSVLTNYLLDFGKSFWASPGMQEEFPGLLSSGFKSTGKYGIGFFSVFMLSDKIKVITRRSDAAAKDTLVLEFSYGLHGCPILRNAKRHEQLLEGGTTVQLQLSNSSCKNGSNLFFGLDNNEIPLSDVCQQIAPSIDVNLSVMEGAHQKVVIEANDWKTIPGSQLLMRLLKMDSCKSYSESQILWFAEHASKNLRLIKDENGEIFGRAFISMGDFANYQVGLPEFRGTLTVGGLNTSSLSGICGILLGKSTRISRDAGEPIVPHEVLAKWAEEQADIVQEIYPSQPVQAACAQNIRSCGGYTKALPIAMLNNKWVSAEDISTMQLPDSIIIVERIIMNFELKNIDNFEISPEVFVTNTFGLPIIYQYNIFDTKMLDGWDMCINRGYKCGVPVTLAGAIIEAATKAWGARLEAVVEGNKLKTSSNVKIGMAGNQEIKVSALVINKPI